MSPKLVSIICLIVVKFAAISQREHAYRIHTVAFYNLENLFDIYDNPITFDNDRTPEGTDHWTLEKYQHKVTNLAKVISEIGVEKARNSPILIGLAEVENRKVLEDLVNELTLKPFQYQIIHYDSPDRRGVDVALLYQPKYFKFKKSRTYELKLYDENDLSKRIYTRDQLVVSGYLENELIYIIVNHWPSRRGGEARSSYKREQAARLNLRIMDSIFDIDPYAKIITMGDFNDDPNNKSITKILKAKYNKNNVRLRELYNPMAKLHKKGIGSLAYGDSWNLFDQLIFSKSFVDKDFTTYQLYKTAIFNPLYLSNTSGKYKGYPFRSMVGHRFTGGYSDHYPVYSYLIKRVD
ncbi:endonuclease/exonuclease/phosphatase family protein [Aquimarina sp. ERC-38]|uniref:endonuclease/exonuclease/phosphatase family protein n=1 Tax=Aquimarina sp. ERC-38 TaxID=2949996 RepID=UPI0022474B59|nr:endonuclease/exonuclease/phosphatase family protein [Aquimarina sp. ERC-38]UZO81817.1 endonuclease/exonuclease/phosphatase family protein [Aquimarina sp. ERC-38]